MAEREYVGVVADYMPDGEIRPVRMSFSGKRAFDIAKIAGITHMSKTKQNGDETRYSVVIEGAGHYLFFEDAERGKQPRWFVLDK